MERATDEFWKTTFGNDYTTRNRPSHECLVQFFGRIFEPGGMVSTRDIRSVLELGANMGHNLVALARVLGEFEATAVEINAKACKDLRTVAKHVLNASFLDLEPVGQFDLVLTKGVLIHVAPADLPAAYAVIHQSARRWILIAEYYSPTPVEKEYRGHKGKLWKRDFAGELLEAYPDLRLADYGFVYHGDPFPQDDITWFLLEKKQ
jgi:spore coat polysaccharide biosynthesis protein SpsF